MKEEEEGRRRKNRQKKEEAVKERNGMERKLHILFKYFILLVHVRYIRKDRDRKEERTHFNIFEPINWGFCSLSSGNIWHI